MTLYEINREIEACVDDETGEIIDAERLEKLELDRKTKIENVGLWYKNLVSDAQALKNEIDVLQDRQKKAEKKAEQLKQYLETALCGDKFKTARVQISYRKSKSVKLDDDFVDWARTTDGMCKLLRYTDPEPNKKAIKAAILDGEKIKHAEIVENNNLTVR